MKKCILLFELLLLATIINAQKVDISQFNAIQTHAIGPAGMSGRITCIDVVNSRTNEIYIGTASGGVWKSTNAGLSWDPLFDKQSLQSIGSITIQMVAELGN